MKSATDKDEHIVSTEENFNPRTHEECDILKVFNEIGFDISIHALMKSATAIFIQKKKNYTFFYKKITIFLIYSRNSSYIVCLSYFLAIFTGANVLGTLCALGIRTKILMVLRDLPIL